MTVAEKLVKVSKNREKLYEAGKKAEYDKNWDYHQDSGRKKNYNYAFAGTWWNDDTFCPKYDMKSVESANNIFCFATISDLKGILERCGVTLDLSLANPAGYAFNGMRELTRLPVINLSGVTAGNYRLDNVFNGDGKLWYIEKFIIRDDGLNTFNNVFNGCTSLTYLRIEGVIGNDINFSACPLSRESMESVISALSDTASGKTVTFKKSAKENAFIEEKWEEIKASKPNWTFQTL